MDSNKDYWDELAKTASALFGPDPFSLSEKVARTPEPVIEPEATPTAATPPPEQCPDEPTPISPEASRKKSSQKKSKTEPYKKFSSSSTKSEPQKKLSSTSTKSEPQKKWSFGSYKSESFKLEAQKKFSTLSAKSTKSEKVKPKSTPNLAHREIWSGPKKWKDARTNLSLTMDMRRMKSKQKPKPKVDLEKKIKPNPKYENIKSSINTGNNTRKQLERMEEIKTYYKFRPDEIFRRITVTSLATLMIESSKLEYQEEDSERLTSQIREDQESLQKLERESVSKSPEKASENTDQEPAQEPTKEEVNKEEDGDDCDADSLDSAIDPDEQRALPPADDPDFIESVVFKGRKIRRHVSNGLHQQHLVGSVGNLLQGFGEITVSPRSINDMSDRTYHHHDSTQAASTFQLDVAPSAEPPRSVIHVVEEVVTIANEPTRTPKASIFQEEPANLQGLPQKRDRPYLILDIRDEEQYKRGRIVTSKSYPAVRLSRSVNYETRELYRFKNVEGKIIVIIDADESLSPNFATTMIQRGYDNVFVLSGGLRVAKIKFPEQLITPCEHDIDDQEDFDEAIGEDQIHVIEAFLEEALTSGTSRMSSQAPSVRSGWPSRISSSQSNQQNQLNGSLPSLTSNQDANGTPQAGVLRHKARQVPLGANYYPPRPQRISAGSRRS